MNRGAGVSPVPFLVGGFMPYTGDPINNPVDRVRLATGDSHADIEFLSDVDYQYFLQKNNNNESVAALEAARAILGRLTRLTRERAGDVEVYGAEFFKNYEKFLLGMVSNPAASLANLDGKAIYAGGISKSDMRRNDANCDNVAPRIYVGFAEGRRVYEDDYEGYEGHY